MSMPSSLAGLEERYGLPDRFLAHLPSSSVAVPCDLKHWTRERLKMRSNSNLVFGVADITAVRTSKMQAMAASSPPRYNRREGMPDKSSTSETQGDGPAHPSHLIVAPRLMQ